MLSIFRRKPETYIENANLESWIRADFVNPLHQIEKIIDGGLVLDIGCGSGILGRLLSANQQIVIDGVDPGVSSDHPGVKAYRHFHSCGVEELIASKGIAEYDWIILADVIEHFSYPDEMLALLTKHTKPEVRFLISTPNVAHLSVRLDMVNGNFDYVPSGILESTHLRLCTLRTLEAILDSAGMVADKILLLNRQPPIEHIIKYGWMRGVLSMLLAGRDPLALTFQFLAIVRKGQRAGGTVLVPIGPVGLNQYWNQLIRIAGSRVKRILLKW